MTPVIYIYYTMMNTLHKSLTIALLAVSIFIAGLSPNLVSAQSSTPEPMVPLTPEEKSWIKAHSAITLSITDDIPPRSFIDKDGQIKGTTADYVRLFEQKLGLKINLVGSDWSTALQLALDHEVDGILQAAELEERKPYLNFTQVYSSTPQAVIASEDEPTISGLDALCGRRVGVLKDSSQSRYLMKHFPCINVVHFKALEQVAYALAGREIHAVFGNYDYYASHFKQAGLVGFKAIYIEYLPPMGFARIGLRNDEPLLVSIFDKAIAAITDEERVRITNRWLGLKFPSVSADLGTRVNLTPEEQAWLAQDHTVRVRVVNFPPYMFLEKDKIKGIVIDYLNLIGQRTGLTFEFSPETRPGQEALKSLKNLQGPDLMTGLSPKAEHEPYMDFSEPYMASARVIFTRTDGEFIATIDDLKGRTLAVPHGTLVHKRIEVEYPDIGLLLCDTDLESIEAVSTGKADAYIGNLIHASYEILQRGFANLKVAAPSPFGDDVHTFGIRRDWPELSSIINKGLNSITSEEKAAIRSKYLKLTYEYGVKPSDILKRVLMVAGSASLILLLFLFWNRSLAKKVRERTSELTGSHKLLEAETDERKGAEDSLRESRYFLKNLTDSMADVVFSIKFPEREIEWLNDSFKMFGYDPDDCIGRTTEFLYRDRADFLASGDRMAEFITDDEQDILHIEQMFKKKDGEVFPTDLTISKYKVNNEVISITGIMRDITERKEAEEKLRASEEKFKMLVTRNEEIIYMIAQDGTFLLSEGKGLSKLGLKPGQVVGESVFELYKEYPQMLTEMRRAFNGETVTVEEKVSGNYFRNWYTPHKDHEGNVIGLLGLSINITERKQAETKLKTYQERLKTLASQSIIAEEKERSRIAADLHDNIGQTLAFARIQVARAKKIATKEDKLTTILDEVSQSLLDTIQETKDLVFDLSSPLLHEIGLGAAISNWLEEQVGRKNSIMVNFVHDDKKLSLNVDMKLILFRNVRELLCNVIKHAQATEVVVSLTSNEEELVIIVRDNGIGFDCDSQANCIGIDTGFGLFSVKQQIEDFGGRLEIDSKAGKGCKATLRVPINR